MIHRFENRLRSGEPPIYPKEILWLCLFSNLAVLIPAGFNIYLGQYLALITLISLVPVNIIYTLAYRNALISLFAYEVIHILQLEPEEAEQVIKEYESSLPEHWFNKLIKRK